MTTILTDEEVAWLRALHQRVGKLGDFGADKDPYVLRTEEWEKVEALAIAGKLVMELHSRMFGSYYVYAYAHEAYPGTGPQHLLTVAEENLPISSWHDRLDKEPPPERKKRPGCGLEEAWQAFSKLTHDERNARWLKGYNLEMPREQSYYFY